MTAAKITSEQIVKCARAGMSAPEVAAEFGLSTHRVYELARDQGVKMRDIRRRKFTNEQLVALMKDGHTASSAARVLGVRESTVRARLERVDWDGGVPEGWTRQQHDDYQILRLNKFTPEEARAIVERPKVKIRATPPEARA